MVVALAGCHHRTARPRPELRVDAAGRVLDGAGVEVGFTDAGGQAFAAVGRDGRPIAIARAQCGTLDRTQPLLRLRPLTRGAHGLEFGDATVAALGDGRAIVTLAGGRWQPLAPPPQAEGARSRVELDDGTLFVTSRFATDADPIERARWVEPAHSARELAERARELADEAALLPPKPRAAVERWLPVIALVSTVEGRFGDPASNPRDTAASVGIFQWATARGRKDDAGSSLARFFARLKARAAAKDALARAAWKACAAEGLDARGDRLLLDGKRASGAELERRLCGPMGSGALRSYQLVAAVDWIEQVRATVVRPGLWGKQHLWPDYAESDGGRTVTLGARGRTFTLRAARAATVGELLRSLPSTAAAVNLGVNRPRFVESALWQALTPSGDAVARVGALVDAMAAGGRRARRARAELAAIIWPTPRAGELDETQLVDEFKRRALGLYRPAERERRARRLATDEVER